MVLLYFFPILFIFVSEVRDYLRKANIVVLDFFPSCLVSVAQDIGYIFLLQNFPWEIIKDLSPSSPDRIKEQLTSSSMVAHPR